MKRVAVIGGGISGLSAAFYLERMRQAGAPIDYTLFESSPRLGGVIRTERIDDFLIEAGPDSFLTAKPWAANLARDAGIGDQLLPSNDKRRKTYVLHRGRLVPLPDGLQMMVPTKAWPIAATPLLSLATKMKMLAEYLAPPPRLPGDADESVATFVSRHFGEETVTRFAAPLLAGIYGGSAERLSVRAALPSMVALEAKHHSLVRGALRVMAEREPKQESPLFTSFRGGMQQFCEAVAAKIDSARICLDSRASGIQRSAEGWQVTTSTAHRFDRVIIALPAHSAATVVSSIPELSMLLSSIPYQDSLTVALAYSCEKLRRCTTLPPGFGFLVPKGENRKIIACTFVHNKFDSRTGDDHVLLRCFLNSGLDRSDAELLANVESELAAILGIKAPTEFGRVYRWPKAMPQYEVGHLDKVRAIDESLKALPGLQLIGNAYRGLGIPDCVREGKLAAERVLAD